MKTAPDPKDVQEFQFKQSSITQITDGFTSAPFACSLLVADEKRGILYIGHENKIVIVKPGEDSDPEWKVEIILPFTVSKIMLNCDCTYLAITSFKPAVLVYSVQSVIKNNLQLLHEIRVSTNATETFVSDLRWNPTISGMLCTVATDHTVCSFHIKDKENGTKLEVLEKLERLDVLCLAWSPKGKQIVVGCKNGNIIQLKPDLKVARTIAGPSPSIGEVISILWISSYQFCAAYLSSEQHINVLIVDAPKGETNAIFTCYEDITYGMLEAEAEIRPCYYFDHIPEWGIIIAASSNSSEIAVLGSTDGGSNWNQWQLVDSGRAQLPLIHTTESYPVGIAVDKSPTRRLTWSADFILPHPVPMLHILSTSGQLCSFHIVNLSPNCPAINSPATEVVSTPPQSKLNITQLNTSVIINDMATSTPRPKHTENIIEHSKPAPLGNIFGDSLKSAGFFNQSESEKVKSQDTKPTVSTDLCEKTEEIKEPQLKEIPKVDNKSTPPKKKKKVFNDESICVRAYLQEQSLFEKELQNRLESQTWECGTEEERKELADRAAKIDMFVRELKETTNSLSNDIAYLKALLLQSFAWVEETKSKNAANIDITPRHCGDSNKILELKRLYYYSQTQLTQATKILDLEWSEHKSQEKIQMKIPSLEFVYQNLVLHTKIITKEKSRMEYLKKRWKSIIRSTSVSSLNTSISSLHISSPKSVSSIKGNTGIIEARCKAIASKTLSFTQEKQIKLKELLSMISSPRIIKPVNPSPVQDRLEATLSSLTSFNSAPVETKNKTEQVILKQIIPNAQIVDKIKQPSPLAHLNSIVARIGSSETNNILNQGKTQNKLTSINVSFPSTGANKYPQLDKKTSTPIPATVSQTKTKQDINSSFNQLNVSTTVPLNIQKSFLKTDSITFGTPQKAQENSMQKEIASKSNKESILRNDSTKIETNLFSTNTLKDILSPTTVSGKAHGNTALGYTTTASTATKTDAMSTFSFATPITPTTMANIIPQDTKVTSYITPTQTFSLTSSTLTTSTVMKTMSQLQPQGSMDLSKLPAGSSTATMSNNSSMFAIDEILSYQIKNTAFSTDNELSLGEMSINVVNGNSSQNTTVTSSANNEHPSDESKVSFTKSLTQSLPNPSTSLFSGQSTAQNSVFGMISTSVPSSSTCTATTVPSVSTFGTQPTTTSTTVFSAFANNTDTVTSLETTTTTSSTTPFYGTASKSNFGDGVPNLSTLNFSGINNSPSSTLNFDSFRTTTSSTSIFSETSSSPIIANSQTPSTVTVSSTTNAFAKPIISPSSISFGSSSNTLVFGNIPATSSNTSIFGGNNADSIFSTNTSSSNLIFGGNSASTFGTPSESVFDSNTQKPASIFNTPSNTSTTSFFGSPTNNSSAPVIGSPTGSTSMFGGTTATASPMAVAGQPVLSSQPAFGQPAFGSQPVFGSAPNIFGSSKLTFGSGFTFGTGTTSQTFGSPPTTGTTPQVENNMSKVFGSSSGSSTFESLANQAGGLSFSSLAQKSPETEKPVFTGGSSFSSWR